MTAYPAITVHDSDVPKHFFRQEIDWANGVGRLYKAISHPNDRFLGVILDHGALADVDYNSKDLRNHREIAGPCKVCLMGKANDGDYIYSFYRTSSHIITACKISTN